MRAYEPPAWLGWKVNPYWLYKLMVWASSTSARSVETIATGEERCISKSGDTPICVLKDPLSMSNWPARNI